MSLDQFPRKVLVLLSAGMILAGVGLAAWALSQLPSVNDRPARIDQPTEPDVAKIENTPTTPSNEGATHAAQSIAAAEDADQTATPAQAPPAPSPATATDATPIAVQLDGAPPALQRLTASLAISSSLIYITDAITAAPVVRLDLNAPDGQPVQEIVFIAGVRFDTIFPVTTLANVQAAWRGEEPDDAEDSPEDERIWRAGSAPTATSAVDSTPDTNEGTNEDTNVENEDAEDGIEEVSEIEIELAAAAEKAVAAGMNVTMADLAAAGLTPAEIGAELGAQYPADAAAQFSAVAVLSDTIPALTQLLGPAGLTVQGYGDTDALVDATWAATNTLALLPFDELQPRLATLAIDGQNPVENANRFAIEEYPLIATLYAHVDAANADQQAQADAFLAQIPATNRDADKLTVLAMTGVTAMVRLSAAQIDRYGPDWAAEVVGPELAAADITHISNEVPFVPECETNIDPDNFNFCSPPAYMEALELSGVDIIGLTGNHQNDFGREDALTSLDIYDEAGLPVYGGGRNKEAAFTPFYIEHNGNRFAFLGANSYGPEFAWATDNLPGSAEFNLAIMSATIRSINEKDLADIVLPELQYQESYDVRPLNEQRDDFNALVRAGADIVTGVQSHVPQAVEFTDDKMIVYGLGNIFFDQMWSRVTREGMIVKHTFYDGRHVSSQILTTLLYDYAQPRWMTAGERAQLLTRVFDASYWE